MPEGQAGSFDALRISNFRILFSGTLLSFTAFFMSTVVQSIVAFELTGTNTAVGSAVFGQGLGMVLLGPIGGAYADRLPRRRVIATGQILSALSLGSLGWLYAEGALRLVHLVVNSFIIGGAFGFIGPARQALVVDLVPIARRGNAMALTNVANTSSRVLGPFFAGLLLWIDEIGAAVAYGTMMLLYLGSALLLIMLPPSVVREGVDETHVFGDLTEGVRYAWNHVRLRHLLFFFVSVMLIGFPHVTLLTGLLENQLDRSAVDLTQMALFSAVGALTASVAVARYADSRYATRIYSCMAIGFGMSLMLLAGSPSFAAGTAAIVLVGSTSGGFNSLNGAVIARETETLYMGRVMSLTLMAFAGFSLTALPLGIAADLYGERVVLFSMGVGVLTLALVMSVIVARDASRPKARGEIS
ncbi:MAG: MFS transporter [bacterium]|nr:MFS transporter [bacterium]